MVVLCFEGPSAAGKTTTARAFGAAGDAFVVPEVNELYARPENESPDWYFERQVERWSLARQQSQSHPLVILDGDPFQPLWYNWAYDFAGWQDLEFIERFYRPRIRDGTIRFPDLYIIFSASEAELRRRKEADASRRRRGFEKHLRMIEPQRRYFRAMQDVSPHRVLFLQAETIEANMGFIRRSATALTGQNEDEQDRLFDKMLGWLRANKA